MSERSLQINRLGAQAILFRPSARPWPSRVKGAIKRALMFLYGHGLPARVVAFFFRVLDLRAE